MLCSACYEEYYSALRIATSHQKRMRDQTKSSTLRQQINLYFDNALDPVAKDELLTQVECDTKCSKLFQKEKNFREYIKNNVRRSSVSPDLIQTIKESIRVL